MHVLDVRLNPSIDRETLQKIMEQVMINSSGNSSEYEWMELIQRPVSVLQQQQQQQQALSMNMMVGRGGASGTVEAVGIINPMTTSGTSAAAAGAAASRRPVQIGGKRLKKRRTTNASFSIKHSATSSIRIKRSKSTGSVTLNKSGLAAAANNGSGAYSGVGAGGSSGHHVGVRRGHGSNAATQWKAICSRLRASRNNRNSPADPDFIDEDDFVSKNLIIFKNFFVNIRK